MAEGQTDKSKTPAQAKREADAKAAEERKAAEAAQAEQQEAVQEAADAAEEKAKEDEPTFPLSRIMANSTEMVGHPPHVVAGAMEEVSGDEFTKGQVKAAIKSFLKVEEV